MDFTQTDYELIDKEFEELRLLSVKRCASQEEYDEVLKAFDFANEAHKGVRRRSGEPYILHPIAVAKVVVQEIGLGYKSIVTALLHDIVEDTDYTVDDIRRLFGDKIASLVDGLTKIKAAFDSSTGGNLQAENFKRILLTLNDDVRVVLIKLADRLHNLRTIEYMPDYKREKILSETMYIFVPLAQRLGLYSMKSEMENICFKNKEPLEYQRVEKELDDYIKLKSGSMDNFIKPINDALTGNGYSFKIIKRTKTPYSIWNKMKTKGIGFDQIYDIYAVRIIFEPKVGGDERTQCWMIYSIISGIYSSRSDRIRDWVSQPKNNGYEALHCTVMSKTGSWIEIQIRSERMNEVAERGLAAHWTYKGVGLVKKENEIDRWLGHVRDVLENPDANALEFLDNFHSTLLDSEIYVFTPKGESRNLPKGSTALDFAYSIHSHIGNKAIAAKVNLKLVPLSKILRNGDQVEIITAESQKPQREWLDFLKTSKARDEVYDAIKEEIQSNIRDGVKILEKELSKYGVTLQSRVLKKLMDEYKVSTKDELYSKISSGIIDLSDLGKILKKNKQSRNVLFWILQSPNKDGKKGHISDEDIEPDDKDETFSLEKGAPKPVVGKDRVVLLKEDPVEHTILYETADCCHPIPGDSVMGFLEDDGSVIVHKKSCPIAINRAAVEGNKIVEAKWTTHSFFSSLARVKILGVDRIGILNDITKYITLVLSVNIRKVLIETHDGIFEGYIDCYVRDNKALETLISHLKQVKGMDSVVRVDIKDN